MGNYWRGISEEALFESEARLLKRGGLREGEYRQVNVRVDELIENDDLQTESVNQFLANENYIHYIEIPNAYNADAPILVLVHGYGAGAGVFFRIVKDLSLYFNLYVVDLLGMGASGRPEYTATNSDEAEEFFVGALKGFINRVIGGRKQFILAGHSLGGYIASVYALRYPEDLQKLVLLSPVGLPERPDTFTQEEVVQRFDTFKDRLGARVILKLWDMKLTPFGPLRIAGSMGTKAFLKFYMARRMKSITIEEELSEMKQYLHQIFLRPGSGEYALSTILQPGMWAHSPLIHRLPALEVPVSFFYGEKDWMDPVPAIILLENKLLKEGALYQIDGADHHLYLDNPIDTVYKIIKDSFGEEIANEYLQKKVLQEEQIIQEEEQKQQESPFYQQL